MNYDHSFHAGSFSDVLKHSVLAACCTALNQKEKPYRVIDAFAGFGSYDLQSEAAIRCPEWQDGIAALENVLCPAALQPFFSPYFAAIAALNANGGQRYYPGSPAVARALARPQDRITLLEANPKFIPQLKHNMRADKRVSILQADAWKALAGLLPPPEKRGLVLIDAPFETENEHARTVDLLHACYKKWQAGTIIAWLPLKSAVQEANMLHQLRTWPKRPEVLYMKLQPHGYGYLGSPLAGGECGGEAAKRRQWRVFSERTPELAKAGESNQSYIGETEGGILNRKKENPSPALRAPSPAHPSPDGLRRAQQRGEGKLPASALIILNPPYVLVQNATPALEWLAATLPATAPMAQRWVCTNL